MIKFSRNTIAQAILVAVALAGSPLASAQVYVGGSFGQSMTKFDGSDWDRVIALSKASGAREKTTKTAYQIFAGYNFNEYFAVEGGYADFGKPSFSMFQLGDPDEATFYEKKTAWFLAGKGTLPINEQFNVFGKLGVTQNRTEMDLNFTDKGDVMSAESRRTGVLYGVGAEYKVTKQLGLRLEYDDFGKFGSQYSASGTGRTKTTMWSLGMAYTF